MCPRQTRSHHSVLSLLLLTHIIIDGDDCGEDGSPGDTTTPSEERGKDPLLLPSPPSWMGGSFPVWSLVFMNPEGRETPSGLNLTPSDRLLDQGFSFSALESPEAAA